MTNYRIEPTSTRIRPHHTATFLHLTLGVASMATSQAGRVLGVQLIPILLLDKHVIALSTKRFCQQKQLRRIQRSLDDDPIATLVHLSVVIRVDSRKYDRGLTHFWRHVLLSLTGSDSDCASRCSNDSTAWLMDTWISHMLAMGLSLPAVNFLVMLLKLRRVNSVPATHQMQTV